MKFEPPPSPMRVAVTGPAPRPCSSRKAFDAIQDEQRRLVGHAAILGAGDRGDADQSRARCPPAVRGSAARRAVRARAATVTTGYSEPSTDDEREQPVAARKREERVRRYVGEPDRGDRPERRARDAERRPDERATARRAARASRRVRRRASTARRPRGCRARGSRRRARAPRAATTASNTAWPRSGDSERRSSTDASTAPTSATAAPPSASVEGRSPVATAIVNGTTAPQATSGETTLIVPSESAR